MRRSVAACPLKRNVNERGEGMAMDGPQYIGEARPEPVRSQRPTSSAPKRIDVLANWGMWAYLLGCGCTYRRHVLSNLLELSRLLYMHQRLPITSCAW